MNTNDDGVCLSCQLAKMQESGAIVTIAIDSGHSACEAEEPGQCRCGCTYSRYQACRECRRKGHPLGANGRCLDTKECARAIVDEFAKTRAARAEREAKAPVKAMPAGRRQCRCGCGEMTGGGMFRPGHDARHVSNLVDATVHGQMTASAGIEQLQFSDKLTAKYRAALERRGVTA